MSFAMDTTFHHVKPEHNYRAPEVVPSKLLLNEQQRKELGDILRNKELILVRNWTVEQQTLAVYFLEEHKLLDHNPATSKWRIRETRTKNNTKRTLFQCTCGSVSTKHPATKGVGKSRQQYSFVGCLAFAWVIRDKKDPNVILAANGYLTHSTDCMKANRIAVPALYLNSRVRELAQNMLECSAPTPAILANNLRFVRDCCNGEVSNDKERFLLTAVDIANISRQMRKKDWGLITRKTVEESLQIMFGDGGDEALKEATVYYKRRETDADRLELVLCTKEQKEMAWTYGPEKLLLLDGTFGVSKHRILLFIFMIIDSDGHGIPVAWIIFSPKSGAKKSSSSYDTEILTKLIGKWHNWLGKNNGRMFHPCAAMTDTDFRERAALVNVWPDIYLLICLFHVGQCWNNKKIECLGRGGTQEVIAFRKKLRAFLDDITGRLKAAKNETSAKELISNAKSALVSKSNQFKLLKASLQLQAAVEGSISFLDYLTSTWMGDLFWGWSLPGREAAANVLKVSVERVPTTNNHLEGFNHALKNLHLKRFQHRGQRLREDVLALCLVKEITPMIILRRQFQQKLKENLQNRSKLHQLKLDPSYQKIMKKSFPGLVYFTPNDNRDQAAKDILAKGGLGQIKYSKAGLYLTVPSQSTQGALLEYIICLHPINSVSCQCIDFLSRGGACKHIRCGILYINTLRLTDDWEHLPQISLPTLEEAIRAQCTAPPGNIGDGEYAVEKSEESTLPDTLLAATLNRIDAEVDFSDEDDFETEYNEEHSADEEEIHNFNENNDREIVDTFEFDMNIHDTNIRAIGKQQIQHTIATALSTLSEISTVEKELEKTSEIAFSESKSGMYVAEELREIREEFAHLFPANRTRRDTLFSRLRNLKQLLYDINEETLLPVTPSTVTSNREAPSEMAGELSIKPGSTQLEETRATSSIQKRKKVNVLSPQKKQKRRKSHSSNAY